MSSQIKKPKRNNYITADGGMRAWSYNLGDSLELSSCLVSLSGQEEGGLTAGWEAGQRSQGRSQRLAIVSLGSLQMTCPSNKHKYVIQHASPQYIYTFIMNCTYLY